MNTPCSRPIHQLAIVLLLSSSLLSISCSNSQTETVNEEVQSAVPDESSFNETMRTHLDAVSARDLNTLKSTLSPDGELQFILPNRELTTSADDFIHYHREWFRDTTWTLEAEIVDTKIGENIGIAITEIIYREPDRDGQPYLNRMMVSYALKNINGNWYVFKDHASSVETSVD